MTDAFAGQTEKLKAMQEVWSSQWQAALQTWSPYIKLHEPVFCYTQEEETREGLTGSFAMIRLTDLSVVLSLRQIAATKLDPFSLEIMAHEIGHHVFCPAD